MEKILKQVNSLNRKDIFWWLFFYGLIIFEYLLFRNYALREIVNYYPAFDDQAFYLQKSYAFYENVLKNGLLATFSKSLQGIAAPGAFFFPIQAAGLYFLVGASRLSALTVNFIYFVGLQFFIAKIIRDITKNNYFTLIFIGLLLSSMTPFMNPGGLLDFRADFVVCCLYGMLVTCIIKAEVFFNKKWTLVATILMLLLISLRFLTVLYIGVLIVALFCYFFYCYKHQTEKQLLLAAKTRLLNLGIFTCGYIFTSMLLILLIGKSLYHYYFLLHLDVINIVKKEEGINSIVQTVLYYPYSILKTHLGWLFIATTVSILLVLTFNFSNRKYHQEIPKQKLTLSKATTFFLWLSFLVPLIILSLDPSKSPIVGGVVLVPICCLLIWGLIISFYPKYQNGADKILLPLLAGISLLFGTYNYCSNFSSKSFHYYADNVRGITEMYQDIGNYLTKNKQDNLKLATDQLNDFMDAPAIAALYYERTGLLLETQVTLCNNQFSANSPSPDFMHHLSREQILPKLKQSEVFILTTSTYPKQTHFPIEGSIRDFHKDIAEFAEHNFTRLGDYRFHNASFRVYVNPKLKILGGTSDGWVSNDGIVIDIPQNTHKPLSKIILTGELGLQWKKEDLKMGESYFLSKNHKVNIQARLEISGNFYRITCFLPKSSNNISRIIIGFASYFIPAKHGFSNDTRHLVIRMPTKSDFF